MAPKTFGTVPTDLSPLKDALRQRIDQEAEACREQYITPGAGQAMTYQQKAAEAVEYLRQVDAGQTPSPENFPLLAAEVGITADDMIGVASVVNGAHQQWKQVGGLIESIRLKAKQDIDAAETSEAAMQAANIIWP